MGILKRGLDRIRALMSDVHQTSRLQANILATLHRQSEFTHRKFEEITKMLSGEVATHAPLMEHIPEASRAFYEDNGYMVFRRALPKAAIEGVREALAKEVAPSKAAFLRHYGATPTPQPHEYVESSSGERIISNALLDPLLVKELPQLQGAIRKLVCTHEVADLLTMIDGERHFTIQQTILFFIPPGTDMHIDGWGMDSWPRGRAYTLWIPLEEVTVDNGALYVAPWETGNFISPEALGLQDFFKRVTEHTEQAYHEYHTALGRYLKEHDTVLVVPPLMPGDAVLFSSLTPHGTMPYRGTKPPSRLAMQVIIRATNRDWTWVPGGFGGQFNAAPDAPNCFVTINERWQAFLPIIHRKK